MEQSISIDAKPFDGSPEALLNSVLAHNTAAHRLTVDHIVATANVDTVEGMLRAQSMIEAADLLTMISNGCAFAKYIRDTQPANGHTFPENQNVTKCIATVPISN